MLKIKDNVDLKELEKYGFGKSWTTGHYRYILDDFSILWVDEHTKEITIDVEGRYFCETIYTIDILFILIQAGLVEKVWGGICFIY